MKVALAAALVALGCGGAAPCPRAPRATPADGRPVLFVVSGPRGQMTLFGTFHAAGRDAIPDRALDRLRGSRLLVTEIPPVSLHAGPRATLPAGESLEEKLGSAAWAELAHAVSRVMDEDALRRAQPWVAMSALTAVSIDQPEVPMDAAIVDVARRRDLPFTYLETPDAQADALVHAVTLDDLRQALAERRLMRCAVHDASAAYRDGDAAAMRGALTGDAEETLLAERNRRWLPILLDFMPDEAFVAVGVSHLVGPGSLPELLEAEGYRVTRLGR
jgi:uncharacterized protein YbaP (TraB family)